MRGIILLLQRNATVQSRKIPSWSTQLEFRIFLTIYITPLLCHYWANRPFIFTLIWYFSFNMTYTISPKPLSIVSYSGPGFLCNTALIQVTHHKGYNNTSVSYIALLLLPRKNISLLDVISDKLPSKRAREQHSATQTVKKRD